MAGGAGAGRIVMNPAEQPAPSQEVLSGVCAALGQWVLCDEGEDRFAVQGQAPEWLARFYPVPTGAELSGAELGQRFPFLGHFLEDARAAWATDAGPLFSGLWNESDAAGVEHHLEACALRVGARRVLVVSGGLRATDDRAALLQRAREITLSHQRLAREVQKKDVLFHCIVHDLTTPLTGIKTSLHLLSQEPLSEEAREILLLGQRQAQRQEMLVREILDVFAAELRPDAGAREGAGARAGATDVRACGEESVQLMAPAAATAGVTLRFRAEPADGDERGFQVAGDASRLDRVFLNLIENALRHAPPGSVVRVTVLAEAGAVLATVEDDGPGVPAEVARTLFEKFSQGQGPGQVRMGKIGLGLYFCRVTVERWGGQIGYGDIDGGGARFWFRLPRA